MNVRSVLMTVVFALAGCQAEYSAHGEGDAIEAPAPKADACANRNSNLEYTKCWQDIAGESRSQLEKISRRAGQAAQLSDQREGPGMADAVGNSQAAWAEFSGHQCLAEGRVARGGTGTRALVAKCQNRLNLQRIDELEQLIKAIGQH